MSVPVIAQLFPGPAQMHAWLDGWVAQANELAAKLAESEARYATDIATLEAEVVRLTEAVASTAAPLQVRITSLTEEIRVLKEQNRDMKTQVDNAVRTLANSLEQNPTAPGVTLLTLIRDMSLLIEETKKQFRRNL